MSKRKLRLWVAIGLGLVLAGGLMLLVLRLEQIVVTTGYVGNTDQVQARAQRALIMANDVPFGWRRSGLGDSYEETPPGALVAVTRSYYGTQDKTWVKVSQQLIIHENTEWAAEAYREELASFNPSWLVPADLSFSGRTDDLYIACIPARINDIKVRSCKVVGRYGDTLSILRGNVFEEQWLTMPDFRRVLEGMDTRVAASVAETEQP